MSLVLEDTNLMVFSGEPWVRPLSRAVARILFQPRQSREPGLWGGAPSEFQGQCPWSGVQGPLKLKAFQWMPKGNEKL